MDTNQQIKVETKAKPKAKSSSYSALRIKKETKRKIFGDLAQINKKDFGKRVRPEAYIALAISLVRPEHLTQLQETSLSNADRLEMDYRKFVSEHGPISKDEYLGKRLRGEATPESRSDERTKTAVK
jgi:hypothetical protein